MSGAHYHVGQGPRCGNMSKSVVRLAQLSGTAETTNQCVSMLFTIISSLEVIVGKIKLPDSSIDTHTYPPELGPSRRPVGDYTCKTKQKMADISRPALTERCM
jgi:hypothetical protein